MSDDSAALSILEVSRRYNAQRTHTKAHEGRFPLTSRLQEESFDGSPPCHGGQAHECQTPRSDSPTSLGRWHHDAHPRRHRTRWPVARSRSRRAHRQPASRPRVRHAGQPSCLRAPHMQGHYSPYPVRDPTAGERAVVAGRVYRSVLDEWARWVVTTPRPGGGPPDLEARSRLELTERLGSWSLRWQEAEDNAARSLAARYQSLADHLGRMTALEEGRPWRESGPANARPVDPLPPRVSAEAARSFRPIDEWEIDRIAPTHSLSERPLNPLGVAVSPAEQGEIAGRVYHAILDEAVNRFLASRRDGEQAPRGCRRVRRPARRTAGILVRSLDAIFRTLRSAICPRDRRRLVSRRSGHDSRDRAGACRRSGRTSSGCVNWRAVVSSTMPSGSPVAQLLRPST